LECNKCGSPKPQTLGGGAGGYSRDQGSGYGGQGGGSSFDNSRRYGGSQERSGKGNEREQGNLSARTHTLMIVFRCF
jgi:hypothetical protein